ncbi:uncharacterized protein LOC129789974 [Lutzomyia longipalpis]|uniref:Putative conserved secreted protein n=1 Tax=Lutzomyia longipalpis TaxID=7200 RepID=A0A7G3AET5_LUTLO|nr:uncharacterized protein LOC129789974 [Lutzomyia longipalpis]
MAKYGFLLFVVLVVALNGATALRCWRCSSDATNAAFCGDPFDPSILTEQQRRWSYVDCSFPPSQLNPYSSTQSRPVCKKMKQKIYDKIVVSRSCFWEDINTPPDTCMKATTPSFIETEFCETCSHDGCNGASQYGPVALLVAIPAVLAKVLAW